MDMIGIGNGNGDGNHFTLLAAGDAHYHVDISCDSDWAVQDCASASHFVCHCCSLGIGCWCWGLSWEPLSSSVVGFQQDCTVRGREVSIMVFERMQTGDR